MNVNNKSIHDYLVWPENPVRKGKRDTERLPFVLTSATWKKMQLDRQEKKDNAEKQKEERKRKREIKVNKANKNEQKKERKTGCLNNIPKYAHKTKKNQAEFSTNSISVSSVRL